MKAWPFLFVILLVLLYVFTNRRSCEYFSNYGIDKVIYINLDHRTDRRKEIESELKEKGISFERFSAIQDANGAIGCCKSHLAILKKAKAQGYKNVLVLEDDFKFTVNTLSFQTGIQNLFQVPFDVCLLAYNCQELYDTEHSFLYRIKNAQTTTGYLIQSHYYDALIAQWEYGLRMFLETGNDQLYTCDQSWKQLQETDKWYGFNPRMGIQRESYSDIQKAVVSYGI